MAWRKLDMPYAMPSRPIDALPGVMCQHDFDDKRLFQHRNMRKWSFYNNPATPGFLHENQCVKLVNELKYIWSPASQTLATAEDLEAMSRLDGKYFEAEWEKACRAKSNTMFCYGDDDETVPNRLSAYAVFSAEPRVAMCGSKMPNGWGLFDMHGNVLERCQDWYDADYYGQSHAADDPQGPDEGLNRVSRGGFWDSGADFCRSVKRSSDGPETRYKEILGFRVARSGFAKGSKNE